MMTKAPKLKLAPIFGNSKQLPPAGNYEADGERLPVTRTVLLLGYFLLMTSAAAQNTFTGVVTEVERGDQLAVKLDSWTLKVRLHGVESPKAGAMADLAQQWTQARTDGHKVLVTVRGTAAKGVVYGDVLSLPERLNLSVELAENGLATWSQRYAPRRRDLALAQGRAQKEHAGIWGETFVEEIRLARQLRALRPRTSAPPKPPRRESAPTATPRPPQPARPTAPPQKTRPVLPFLLGALGAAGLLALAEAVSRDARRLRQRPTLLSDAAQANGPVKIRGIARADGAPVVSLAGRIPGLYVREITQEYHEGAWRTTYNETDSAAFLLDDGSGQTLIEGPTLRFHPVRVARFYNDIPVEKWHARSYGGDIRSEVFFIPPDVTVVVYGTLTEPRSAPLAVIEGDERRLTQKPVRLALGLLGGALLALVLGGAMTLSGAG
jgi:endonuclease YncB( thermonuclease family)